MDPSPFSKEAMRQYQPGNRKKDSNKTQGTNYEKHVKNELQGTSKSKVKRNNQAKAWGGISNPDIEFGPFNIETKDAETLEIPKWTRNILQETPPHKKPGIGYKCEGRDWISIILQDRIAFAVHVIEELGGTVELPYWVNI